MIVQAYLNFDGRCEEAVEFYRGAVGAEVQMLMRFSEAPEGAPRGQVPPGSENKVLHTSFRIGETVVMASDGHCQGNSSFRGFCLSVSVASEAEADKVFDALADGGRVDMPLAKTFFSQRFGMLV